MGRGSRRNVQKDRITVKVDTGEGATDWSIELLSERGPTRISRGKKAKFVGNFSEIWLLDNY